MFKIKLYIHIYMVQNYIVSYFDKTNEVKINSLFFLFNKIENNLINDENESSFKEKLYYFRILLDYIFQMINTNRFNSKLIYGDFHNIDYILYYPEYNSLIDKLLKDIDFLIFYIDTKLSNYSTSKKDKILNKIKDLNKNILLKNIAYISVNNAYTKPMTGGAAAGMIGSLYQMVTRSGTMYGTAAVAKVAADAAGAAPIWAPLLQLANPVGTVITLGILLIPNMIKKGHVIEFINNKLKDLTQNQKYNESIYKRYIKELVRMYNGEELSEKGSFYDKVPTYDLKIDSEFKIDGNEFTIHDKTKIIDIYLCILLFNVMRKKNINLDFMKKLKEDAKKIPENYNLFKIPNLLLDKEYISEKKQIIEIINNLNNLKFKVENITHANFSDELTLYLLNFANSLFKKIVIFESLNIKNKDFTARNYSELYHDFIQKTNKIKEYLDKLSDNHLKKAITKYVNHFMGINIINQFDSKNIKTFFDECIFDNDNKKVLKTILYYIYVDIRINYSKFIANEVIKPIQDAIKVEDAKDDGKYKFISSLIEVFDNLKFKKEKNGFQMITEALKNEFKIEIDGNNVDKKIIYNGKDNVEIHVDAKKKEYVKLIVNKEIEIDVFNKNNMLLFYDAIYEQGFFLNEENITINNIDLDDKNFLSLSENNIHQECKGITNEIKPVLKSFTDSLHDITNIRGEDNSKIYIVKKTEETIMKLCNSFEKTLGSEIRAKNAQAYQRGEAEAEAKAARQEATAARGQTEELEKEKREAQEEAAAAAAAAAAAKAAKVESDAAVQAAAAAAAAAAAEKEERAKELEGQKREAQKELEKAQAETANAKKKAEAAEAVQAEAESAEQEAKNKEKDAVKHFPSKGEGTLSGIIIEAEIESGLAKKVTRLIKGGSLA